ncbi:MAG TPA: response regulator [Steroidobacteraceae bacterium]|nr:response regulator [Steroidobacteraceae bacterium]
MAAPLGDLVRVPEKVNILLVDDQPARLLTYRSILSVLNQNLVCASSGREALQKLMQDDFAVVLLDVSMPEMDGFETAQLIHEHPRFERTPIIFVTGVHVSELDRLKGYKAGAVDYVSIPVIPEILRSKVSVLVELHCKRRELSELNRSLAQTNEQLSQANAALQVEKTRELEAVNATLQTANADLALINRSLQSEIRERLRAEEALKDADRQKNEFLAMLAHELRNPLAPIKSAVQLLRMEPLHESQLQLSREVIERQLTQLTRLVDDLLDVSRITRGKINLTREPLEVADLIARAVETVAPLLREREHQFSTEIPERPLRVDGDCVRLTQVIANVLSNAAKYTEPGGRVQLAVRELGDEVEIRIADSGAGIAPDVLPRVFDLFTQFDARPSGPQAGLGIGLAIARRLVAMHGGGVSAHSDGPGRGSEFVIRLPLMAEVAEPPQSTRALNGGKDLTAGRRRIVVADDNLDALESMLALLRGKGHEVYGAADGELALAAIERHNPEIALLDIGMPKLDGYEVARSVRAQPWGRGMVLVAVTGWGQKEDRRRSHQAGFDAHLVKPVDLEMLNELFVQLPAMARAC